MDLKAEHYYRAGAERMAQARYLYDSGDSYALAMYAAGLAVECVLRAFRWRKDPSFEGRHDLAKLFKESGLSDLDEARMRARAVTADEVLKAAVARQAAVDTVAKLWSNNYRFASEARVRAHLKSLGLYRGVRGDVLKVRARDLLTAAQHIIDKGVALWAYQKK
jgi:HEPN domain-containing protein